MQETESIDEYILQHIDPESDYLKSLYRDTHVKYVRNRYQKDMQSAGTYKN